MQAAPTPEHEAKRLAALRSYNILDSQAEKIFDDLVELASEVCGVPIALISLIDEERQWFKARKGLDASQTSREVAFCSHAILGSEIMQVPDASLDHRFADNPLVTNYPSIRFYAGAPLETHDGHRLGTLCVIDRKPNELNEIQKRALKLLSSQVVHIIESRKERKVLFDQVQEEIDLADRAAKAQVYLDAILRSALDYFVLIAPNMEVIAFNDFADDRCLKYTGKRMEVGRLITEFILEQNRAFFILNFQKAVKGETVAGEIEIEHADAITTKVWVRFKFTPAIDGQGNIIGVGLNMVNIQHRKEIQQLALEQNHRLDDIARIQSHELRGPLASILGLIRLIDSSQLSPEDAKLFELLASSSTKLDDVIREVVKTTYIPKTDR